MPPLRLVPLSRVDVIKCSRLQVIAPAVAVGHDIRAVVVTLIDRVGIKSRGGDAGPQAVLLQLGPLRRAVLLPAERPQRRTAPRQRAVSPEVGLGHVAAPIPGQLRGQALGLVGIGYGMIFGVPAGFQVLHIVGIVRHDPGELGVAPPGGQAVLGSFDDDPMTLLLFSAGRVIAKGRSSRRGWRQPRYPPGSTTQLRNERNFSSRS